MPTLNCPTIRQAAAFSTEPAINEFAIYWLEKLAISMMAFQYQMEIPPHECTRARELLEKLLRIDVALLDPNAADINRKLEFMRYAPSIITRGEIEVMGLSIPRFALRCYLSHNGGSEEPADFINMRRLNEEARYVRDHWQSDMGPNPHSEFITLEKLARRLQVTMSAGPSPRDLVETSSPIADCFLRHRNENDRYLLLEAPLGLHYGECQDRQHDVPGTPYVQGTSLTGMCAQAVCFMANSILLEYAESLSGIAEISRIASADRSKRLSLLQGLTPKEVETYFCSEEVGLWTERQYPSPVLTLRKSNRRGALIKDWYLEALSSYVRSGFPVILPCDLAKLNLSYKEHELVRREFVNSPLPPEGSSAEEVTPHFVCVVGIRRDPLSSEMVVNDPAFLPFLRLPAELLRGASLGSKEAPIYMPVVPARVKVPLNAVLREGRERKPGLRDFVAEKLEHLGSGWRVLPMGKEEERRHVKYRLFHIRKGVEKFTRFMNDEFIPAAFVREATAWAKGRTECQGDEPGLWVWLQYTDAYLWLWNAEKPLESHLPLVDLLEQHVYFACDRERPWESSRAGANPPGGDHPPRQAEGQAAPAGDNHFSNLSVGLINSFGAIDYAEAMAYWPQGVNQAEIYCFLRKEWLSFCAKDSASAIPARLRVRGAVSALMSTGRLGTDTLEELVDNCAMDLNRELHHRNITVGSFATFIPEISSHVPVERDDAIAALKFLVNVAERLRAYQHDVRFIEIVGGSRIQGVSYGWNNKLQVPAQAMIMQDEEDALKLLINSLHKVVEHAAPKSIWLALEMEPGPLHLLNALDPIEKVLGDESLKGGVGLNLDLAHFRILGGIEPHRLLSSTRNRILGVHISGHSKGHLGDLHVNARGQLKGGTFDTWLNYLDELAREGKTNHDILYRGVVNVEMESCRCEREVQSSCDALHKYLSSNGKDV